MESERLSESSMAEVVRTAVQAALIHVESVVLDPSIKEAIRANVKECSAERQGDR